MEISGVDNLLMTTFGGMNDIGNVDVEKYSKGIFSPSPKNDDATLTVTQSQKVSSPQKSISPHVVPHFQHQMAPQPGAQQIPRMSPIPQPPFQPPPPPPHHHHMQRKVQLGPNFDRLGILNQANEIPPMSAPYFAKALQQHGGGTLGAILQAHQHALQQQMQRESFLLQQAVQQQMFQNVPFNIYHQQRMSSMMMDRRTDDQIVPNGQMIPPPESWLKHSTRPSPSKRMKIKHEDSEITERRTCYKHNGHMSESNDKYVIFNDDNNHGNQNSDDDDSSPPIAPPKDSVFVRYPTDSYKTLPSFSQTFSGHIEKLKLKEQHLKDSLMRHGVSEHMIPEAYANAHLLSDNPINSHLIPDGMIGPQMLSTPCSREQMLSQTNVHHLQSDIGNGETLIPISGMVDQFISDNSISHSMLPQPCDIKTETDDTNGKGSGQYDNAETQLKETNVKVENETKESTLDNKIENIDPGLNFDSETTSNDTIKEEARTPQNEDNQLDFLNLNSLEDKNNVKENDLLTESESDKSSQIDTSKLVNDLEKSHKNDNENVNVDRETENATNNINLFQSDLDLDTDNPNYDNLFNGNSDEHYFQAFKENNLHLMNDLNENKVDGGDDILKLLHSPLDFLNDKFLK